MPQYEELIGSFMSDRDDGEPTKPAVPGAPPGVSTPSGPNPPSVNGAPPGRPKDPPMAGASAGPSQRDPETVEEQKQPELARQRLMLSKVPSAADRMDLPPDTDFDTPYGQLGEDGEIAFTPEGEQKYNEQLVHARKGFGAHPFADRADAPEIGAKLGEQFINPFSGQWGRY